MKMNLPPKKDTDLRSSELNAPFNGAFNKLSTMGLRMLLKYYIISALEVSELLVKKNTSNYIVDAEIAVEIEDVYKRINEGE